MDSKADAQQRRGGAAPAEVVQLDRIVDEMRLKKSAKEIELMQIASNISAEAHTRAMQTVKPNDGVCA
jgi:Xaa-Pro aminopeptidase